MNDAMFQPLTSKWSPEAVIPGSPRISGHLCHHNVNPSPEASMRWVDYFYSEEGTKYIEQGPEGVLWEYKENADGQKYEFMQKALIQKIQKMNVARSHQHTG